MADARPLSIRLGDCQGGVEAHMARTGLSIRSAVLDLIKTGLRVEEGLDVSKPVLPRRTSVPVGRVRGFDPQTGKAIIE